MTNYEIAEMLNELSDDDFLGVMRELAQMNDCHEIGQFTDWLKRVLEEIENEEYGD